MSISTIFIRELKNNPDFISKENILNIVFDLINEINCENTVDEILKNNLNANEYEKIMDMLINEEHSIIINNNSSTIFYGNIIHFINTMFNYYNIDMSESDKDVVKKYFFDMMLRYIKENNKPFFEVLESLESKDNGR